MVVLIKAKNVRETKQSDIDKTLYATETKAGIIKIKNSITGVQEDVAVSEKAVSKALKAQLPLGIDQTWQDVTTQRQLGVTYTNTTERTITIKVITKRAGGSFTCKYYIDNIVYTGSDSYQFYTDWDLIIPPKSTYKIEIMGGVLDKWFELR